MHRTTYDLITDQLRAIYRALTGSDAPPPPAKEPTGAPLNADELSRQFAGLDAMARTIPAVAEKVPPFAFAPATDVIDEEKELLVEVAISDIDKEDVEVELYDGRVVVSGTRRGERAADGRTYLHAEIPRGPFRRVVRLPCAVSGKPRVEVERGLVRIWFRKALAGA